VLRAGLRLLADEEAKRQAELEAVRSLVQAGADSLDRGELVDADDFFKALRQKYSNFDDAGKPS
jgi:Arc/MetJ-type ribon-helix-helix transcriptional regulator